MAKIKVPMEALDPSSGAEPLTPEGLAAIAADASGLPANAAEVIRDADGKLVQVNVNLPDGDAPGLAVAADKIANSRGVVGNKVTQEPINVTGGVESFESGVDGANLETIGDGNFPLSSAAALRPKYSSDEASDGSLSASLLIPDNGDGFSSNIAIWTLQPDQNYLSAQIKFKYFLKKPQDVTNPGSPVPVLNPEIAKVSEVFDIHFAFNHINVFSGSGGQAAGTPFVQLAPWTNPSKNQSFSLAFKWDEWISVDCKYTSSGTMTATLTNSAGSETLTATGLDLSNTAAPTKQLYFQHVVSGAKDPALSGAPLEYQAFIDELEIDLLEVAPA